MLSSALTAVLVSLVSSGHAGPTDAAQQAQAKLQGNWKAVLVWSSSEDASPEELEHILSAKVTFKEDVLIAHFGQFGTAACHYTLDPSKGWIFKSMELDIDLQMEVSYSVDGDNLMLVFTEKGANPKHPNEIFVMFHRVPADAGSVK